MKGEIQASNGVIYLIDEVLEVPEGTVYDILHNPAYNLSRFANLVHLVGYDRTFNTSRKTLNYFINCIAYTFVVYGTEQNRTLKSLQLRVRVKRLIIK